jgi:mRNA interferase YafQ
VIRALNYSTSFERALRKIINKRPQQGPEIVRTLQELTNDAFSPSLKTHKLKGELKNRYACSAGYDLRIIFNIIKVNDQEMIHLLSLGNHDAVY